MRPGVTQARKVRRCSINTAVVSMSMVTPEKSTRNSLTTSVSALPSLRAALVGFETGVVVVVVLLVVVQMVLLSPFGRFEPRSRHLGPDATTLRKRSATSGSFGTGAYRAELRVLLRGPP